MVPGKAIVAEHVNSHFQSSSEEAAKRAEPVVADARTIQSARKPRCPCQINSRDGNAFRKSS